MAGWVAYGAIEPLAHSALGWMPNFIERWLAGFVRIIIIGLLLIVGYFIFFGIAALFAAPFNEFLSESLEAELMGEPPAKFSLRSFLFDLVVGMGHSAPPSGCLSRFCHRAVPYRPAHSRSRYFGRHSDQRLLDRPLCRLRFHGCRLGTARLVVSPEDGYHWQAHSQRALGLGTGVSLMMLAPLANLFALSAGAAGATLMVLDIESKGLDSPDGGSRNGRALDRPQLNLIRFDLVLPRCSASHSRQGSYGYLTSEVLDQHARTCAESNQFKP